MKHNCIDPKTISLYLDGQLSSERMQQVAHHLERCKMCRNDYIKWQKLQQLLVMDAVDQLPKRTTQCPDEEALGAYFEKGLSGPEKKRWEKHITGCKYCQHELRMQTDFKSTPTVQVPKEAVQRAKAVIKRFCSVPRVPVYEVVIGWAKQGLKVLNELAEGLELVEAVPVGVRSKKSGEPNKMHLVQIIVTVKKTKVMIRVFKDAFYSHFHVAAIRIGNNKIKLGIKMPGADGGRLKELDTKKEAINKTTRAGKQEIILYADGKPECRLVLDLKE